MTLVAINLVVRNGERYIRLCLDAVKKQNYPNLEVTILDNNSTDKTADIVAQEYPEFRLLRSERNLGTWPGQEFLVSKTSGQYIVALSVDVILEPDFIEQAIAIFERDKHIGAVQPKIYQYELMKLPTSDIRHPTSDIIDTCGFEIFRSRRVTNIGHGQADRGQYNHERDIFAVEGAAPVLRRSALESIRVKGKFADPEFFWYGDDLDLAWRMQLFGWRQIYSPKVVAWHDRSTTKSLRRSYLDFIRIRRSIPLFKRRLDLRNKYLTFIKNDYLINICRDIWPIVKRELALWLYYLVFEPIMIVEIFEIVKRIPNMLQQRREILSHSTRTASEIHTWFQP